MTATLRTIRLELARDPGFPEGSPEHGYEFVAPLGRDGHIDVETWRKDRAKCKVRRFWRGADDQHGHLIHTQGRRWTFHYDLDRAPQDDESGWKFDAHVFKPGEYVSVTEQDGETRTFRVVKVA
jgi:hypothetical protein